MTIGKHDSTEAQSRFFLHILVCSAEGPEKNYPLLRTLRPNLDSNTRILVLCAEGAQGSIEDFGPYVEFRIFPGSIRDRPSWFRASRGGIV